MSPRARLRASAAVAAAIACATSIAAADESCRAFDRHGDAFVTCFDPGNRLRLDVSTAGAGAGVQLRQRVATDDLRIHYRLEHTLFEGLTNSKHYDASVYSLRLVRHSDSGFLVLPTRPPRQLSVPFDLALEASALRLEGVPRETTARVGVVRVAMLADWARSSDGRLRLALGPAMRWDATIDLAQRTAAAHDVAPFTLGAVSAYVESANGLTLMRANAEAGYQRDALGFHPRVHADLSFERVVLSLDDRPVSIFAAGRYDGEGHGGLGGEIGLRFAIVTGAR